MRQLLLDLNPPSPPTLANFVAGHNTELLIALAEFQAERGERLLYLWGRAGAGKTHLLAAAVAAGGSFVAAGRDALTEIPDGARAVAVDDVHRLGAAEAATLLTLCDRARAGGLRLLASGPCPPAQLDLLPDLRTRLAWGLTFRVQPLSEAEKLAALASHARARGFELHGEVARYLMAHWRRDMASLAAVLEALDRYSLETRRAITIPLVKEVIGRGAASP